MVWYIGIIVFILIGIYVYIIYNNFVNLDNKVKEAFSTMDVYLKKRWDLIPNIVDSVKGYASHEKETLEHIVSLRNSEYDDLSSDDKIKTNKKLNRDINQIMALVESYPDLKASENFKDLSDKLVMIEDDIANSRKYYNGVVRIYNNKVQMFPSNIVAKIFGYECKFMFEINENERENININL